MRMEFIHKKVHENNSFLTEAEQLSTAFLAILLILIHLNFTCSEISNKIPSNFFKIRESPGLPYGCCSLVLVWFLKARIVLADLMC